MAHYDGGAVLAAGQDTARVQTPATPAEAHARAVRDADALAYLHRTGNADLAEILGLARTKPARRAPKPISIARTRSYPEQTCPGCGNRFTPPKARQQCCSPSCASAYGHMRRKAKARVAAAVLTPDAPELPGGAS
jgi:hypothetical protein